MTDMNFGLEWWTEDASLIDQISDEALETAADMTNQVAYTLGACTGLSACPA
jgi:hypothetical protein